MFGRLTLDAFKHEASQNVAVINMLLGGIALIGLILLILNAGNGSGMNG